MSFLHHPNGTREACLVIPFLLLNSEAIGRSQKRLTNRNENISFLTDVIYMKPTLLANAFHLSKIYSKPLDCFRREIKEMQII